MSKEATGRDPNGNANTSRDGAARLQIIDDQKNFTKELSAQMDHWGLREAGFDYNIVAVFGSQSTGKSTLLNRLFGTDFDVMNEKNRKQTTKGIWMCRGKGMNALVMDVEGTDGRERGEDQDFERKSALFSLASSEVLIINLWEHQVGLYQGANMGLLKTVFEVNLGLFGKREDTGQRTLLLFVIRDHIGTTPLANLASTLETDLNRIWESLSKPDELSDCKLSDYFDLSFTALPHKILAAEKFESETLALRRRFVNKSNEDYVFKPAYHKRIPADGVALYMEGIWEQVQSNKDLDLPTQQELLAQFRCDEIASVALAEFNEHAKPQRRPIEAGRVVDGLGGMMRKWKSRAISRYDKDASRYHQGVYQRKRSDLLNVIDSVLSPLFLGQLKNLHKSVLVAFKKEMQEGMRVEGYNFADVCSQARELCEKRFVNGAKEAKLEDTDWVWEDELGLLREEMGSVADQCRADETKKMINSIERALKKQISEPVELLLSSPTPGMWDKVLIAFRQTLDKAENLYLSKARSFNSTKEEDAKSLAILRKRAWMALRAKIDEQTTEPVLLSKLRTHFEERFRYDEHGVPRVWKPDDDIDGTFKKARDQTVELIPLYAKIKPQDPSLAYELPDDALEGEPDESQQQIEVYDFDSSLTILSETRILDITSRFRKDADAYYVEAKRSTVSSIAQIPGWMYAVLVVLGWNEAMVVLFNPLYFAFVLCALASAWIIIKLGLLGPLLQISKTVMNEVQHQATERLRQQFVAPVLTEPVQNGHSRKSYNDTDEESIELRRRRTEPL
ncbi:root hair defective 3 GTP-binding protein [Fomitiporia mediterranea MF3/22]|uniref:root hair defective 3 GTP-binding protein n=1 Tax=Fomitiporia mediterranea (strain MF3/22) TaxID=694068 RepID=UPI000440743D|nr:root hair defective 3 GTP-binding protein [Fomitiporia mediterranea MF3/22]EJD03026.1 root hair defective 3 GTP-binding protein [Fomitiporia mediterranea MF3/22]